MKKARAALIAVMVALLAFGIAACNGATGGPANFELTSFEVAATDTVGYNEFYSIPPVIARGNDGVDYLATVSLSYGGEDISSEIHDMSFQAKNLGDYTLTYTVTAGGKEFKKNTVVSCIDNAGPIITVDSINDYAVGDKFTPPQYSAHDTLDGDVTASGELRKKGSDAAIEIPASGYVFDSMGEYEYVVRATDSKNNTTERVVEFRVRAQRTAGEYEAFNDPYAEYVINIDGTAAGEFTQEEVGGLKPANGGYYYKVDAKAGTGTRFVNIIIAPRFGREELKAWMDAGYTDLEIRYYAESSRATGAYASLTSKLNGTDVRNHDGSGDVANTWTSIYLSDAWDPETNAAGKGNILQAIYDNYDGLTKLTSTFIWFSYTSDFTLYIDSLRVVKQANVEMAPITGKLTGSQLTLDDLDLAATALDVDNQETDPLEDKKYEVMVVRKGDAGVELTADAPFTFAKAGEYTVYARLADDEYSGWTSQRFIVEKVAHEEKVFDMSKWPKGHSLETNVEHTLASLDLHMTDNDGEVGPERIKYTFTAPSEKTLTLDKDHPVTFDEVGYWTAAISVDDEPFSTTYTFLVRTRREEGEYECFNDQESDNRYPGNIFAHAQPQGEPEYGKASYTNAAVGGVAPETGYYAKFEHPANSTTGFYICIRPRFTADEVQSWIDNKTFNAIQFRIYVECGASGDTLPLNTFYLYDRSGDSYGTFNPKEAGYKANRWETITITGDGVLPFIRDAINTETKPGYGQGAEQLFHESLWYLFCVGSSAGDDYTIYIDYVKLVNAATVTFGEGMNGPFLKGAKLTTDTLGLTAVAPDGSNIDDAEYDVTITHNGATVDFDTEYTFDEVGEYTVTASLKGKYYGTVSKTYTVDVAAWTEGTFEATYETETEYTLDSLGVKMTDGSGAVENSNITLTFTPPTEGKEPRTLTGDGTVTFDEIGTWKVKASVGGHELVTSYEFLVRTKGGPGEYEAFGDNLAAYKIDVDGTAAGELVQEEVGGIMPADGDYYLKVDAKAGTTTSYVNIIVAPRFTKEQLKAWIDDGYTDLEVRYYVKSDLAVGGFVSLTSKLNNGNAWNHDGTAEQANMWVQAYLDNAYDPAAPNPTEGNPDGIGKNVKGHLLQAIYDNYDAIKDLSVASPVFFFSFNHDMTLYIDYLRVVKEADVTMKAISGKVAGSQLTYDELGLSAAEADSEAKTPLTDKKYEVKVVSTGADAVDLTADKPYTFEQAGEYTVYTRLVDDVYSGWKSQRFIVDSASWTDSAFDMSKWARGFAYETEKEYTLESLGITMTDGAGESIKNEDITLTFTPPTEGADPLTLTGSESVTFNEVGNWTVKAAVKGEELVTSYTFLVRTKREAGEFECFNDEYAKSNFGAHTNASPEATVEFVTSEVGGETPETYFAKGSTTARELWLQVRPRFTKDELTKWIADGTFNAVQVRFYIEYKGDGYPISRLRFYYNHGENATFELLDPTNATTMPLNTWNTFTFYADRNGANPGGAIQSVLDHYDGLFAASSWYFLDFIGSGSTEYSIYLDYVKLVNAVDVKYGDGMDGPFYVNSTLTKDTLGLTAAKKDGSPIQDAEFNVTITHNGADVAFDEANGYTFNEAGNYTVTAAIKGKYYGTVSKTYTVDVAAWTNDKAFDMALWDNGFTYEVGDTLNMADLSFDMTDGNGAVDNSRVSFKLTPPSNGDPLTLTSSDSVTLNEVGYWTVNALVDGKQLVTAKQIAVRTKREVGEIECFSDDIWNNVKFPNNILANTTTTPAGTTASYTMGNEEVGGESGNYAKFVKPAGGGNDDRALYMNFRPRFTEAELDQWIADKTFNAVEIRFYVDYTGDAELPFNAFLLYDSYKTYQFGQVSPRTMGYKPNKWETIVLDGTNRSADAGNVLSSFIKPAFNESGFFNSEKYYFMFLNGAWDDDKDKGYTIYLDYVKLVNVVDVSFGKGMDGPFYVNSTVTTDTLGLTATKKFSEAAMDAPEYDIKVSHSGNDETFNGNYTFNETGEYTFTATIKNEGSVGTVSKTVTVDVAAWTDSAFDQTKWAKGFTYETNVPYTLDGLGITMTDGAGKVANDRITLTFTPPSKGNPRTLTGSESVTFNEVGNWTVKASVGGTELITSYEFLVRTKREEGEFECFNDEFAKPDFGAHTLNAPAEATVEFVTSEVGGETPDTYFPKAYAGGGEMFLNIRPRFTKDELTKWINEGTFNAVQVRFYIEYKGDGYPFGRMRFYYNHGANATFELLTTNAETVPLNTWNTLTFNGDNTGANPGGAIKSILEHYDGLFAARSWYFLDFIGSGSTEYSIYLDYVKLIKQ